MFRPIKPVIKPKEEKPVQHKFGSKEFFTQYIKNQIEKEEGDRFEIAHRIHFSMTTMIFETQPPKDAMGMIKNLTEAVEKVTEWNSGANYIE